MLHPDHQGQRTRHVSFVVYSGVDAQDVVGPYEVFACANHLAVEAGFGTQVLYALELIAVGESLRIETLGGIVLEAQRRYDDGTHEIDTLLVAGGNSNLVVRDPELLGWLRRIMTQTRRIGSICIGAFVLAAAGILDGRRAVTHWQFCADLARLYPRVTVDPDPIYIRDGHVYSCAGITAGMDLALALVEEDYGRALALRVARQLVMFSRRPGGQSQFSALLELQSCDQEVLQGILIWIVANPSQDLSVEQLAERTNMSVRNFSRVFHREVGQTPARFVEQTRVDTARRRLESSEATLERIAHECGFGNANALRRSFLRVLRVLPSDYRSRFRSGISSDNTKEQLP